MIYFGILRIFGEKLKRKKANWKSGHIELLRRSVGNPCRDEAEVPKRHPLGTPRRSKAMSRRRPTPQRSSATPWRSYYSQRAKFWILFQKSSFCTPIV